MSLHTSCWIWIEPIGWSSRINGVEEEAETVWANGEISDVMQGSRMVTINHQPVPEWDWPGMVMEPTAEGLDMRDVMVNLLILKWSKRNQSVWKSLTTRCWSSNGGQRGKGRHQLLMADWNDHGKSQAVRLGLKAVRWTSASGHLDFHLEFTEGQSIRFLARSKVLIMCSNLSNRTNST